MLDIVAAAIVLVHRWFARPLLGWDIAAQMYLTLIMAVMLCAGPHRIRVIARHEDARAPAVLAVVCFGMMASVAAITFELATTRSAGYAQTSHYVFTGITMPGAQLMAPIMSTVCYAHPYYCMPHEPPLRFPDEQLEPGYWDFLYSSSTIAIANQTADVSIHSCAIRRAVLGQSLLSSFPSTSTLVLSINIAADPFS